MNYYGIGLLPSTTRGHDVQAHKRLESGYYVQLGSYFI